MVEILYEDNHLIVCIKPQNVPSQQDSSLDKDMLTMVKEYIKEKYNKPGNVYVGLVHRLDRPTGGLMVFAKTSKAASRLSAQFAGKGCHKQYLAVANGSMLQGKQKIESYLKKDEKTNIVTIAKKSDIGAKKAELEYELIASKNNLSLVKVNLFTGRSHQIRVQMQSVGHALFGDAKYGNNQDKNNLALWSYHLEFEHPTLKKIMQFTSLPNVNVLPWNIFENEIKSIK